MKALTTLLTFAALLFMATGVSAAEEDKLNINAVGRLTETPAKNGNMKFVTEEGPTYYIYTKAVLEELKPHLDSKVRINGVARKTKNGKVYHIVWLNSAEAVD
jgi:hypothetical protein